MIEFIQFGFPTDFPSEISTCVGISLWNPSKDMTCKLLSFELASGFGKISLGRQIPIHDSDSCDILRIFCYLNCKLFRNCIFFDLYKDLSREQPQLYPTVTNRLG